MTLFPHDTKEGEEGKMGNGASLITKHCLVPLEGIEPSSIG